MNKYNERIKFLEKLRKEALRDLNDIENDLGINDHSFIESNDTKSYSPKKLSPPKISPRKKQDDSKKDQNNSELETNEYNDDD